MERHEVVLHLLLYGDFPQLHDRILSSVAKYAYGIRARIWCNQICDNTFRNLMASKDQQNWMLYFSKENRPKYQAMRELFQTFKKPEGERDDATWIVWMDDDSYICAPDWWDRTTAYIEQNPSAVYIGQPWFVHHLKGQDEFFQKSSWYRGLPWEMCPTKNGGKSPGITFAQGGYWWLKSDIVRQLDWPDPRLNHNGGDTLLGEAVRQQGLPFHKFHYGVRINAATRRGYHEAPAGAENPRERR